MQVQYNARKSEVTIRLSWTEIRQFLMTTAAVNAVRKAVAEVCHLPHIEQQRPDTDLSWLPEGGRGFDRDVARRQRK